MTLEQFILYPLRGRRVSNDELLSLAEQSWQAGREYGFNDTATARSPTPVKAKRTYARKAKVTAEERAIAAHVGRPVKVQS